MVPLVKNKNASIMDKSNYRPIALSTVLSKLFEITILHKIKEYISTTDNQFGFKAGVGTDLAAFIAKETIASYITGSGYMC